MNVNLGLQFSEELSDKRLKELLNKGVLKLTCQWNSSVYTFCIYSKLVSHCRGRILYLHLDFNEWCGNFEGYIEEFF